MQVNIEVLKDAFPEIALISIGVTLGGLFQRFRSLEKKVDQMHKENKSEILGIRRNLHVLYRTLVRSHGPDSVEPFEMMDN